MNRFFSLVWGILFFPILVYAQQLDSLNQVLQTATDTTRVNVLQDIGYAVMSSKPDSAIRVFEQSLALANKLRYEQGIVNAYGLIARGYEYLNDKKKVVDHYKMAIEAAVKFKLLASQGTQYLELGNYYAYTDDATLALTSYKNAQKLFIQADDQHQLIEVYKSTGMLYSNQGEYVEALKNNFRALEIIESMKDTRSLSDIYNSIAIIYKKQKNIKDALTYYNRSLEIARRFDNQIMIAVTNANIALIHKDNHRLDSARTLLKESLKFFLTTDYYYSHSQLYHNLSVVYLNDNQVDSALYYLNQSQALADKYNYQRVKCKNHIQFAKICQKQGKYERALSHIDKSIAISKAISSTETIEEALGIKHGIYNDMRKPAKAYLALKEYQKYHDSLFNSANSRQIGMLKTTLQLKEKEKEVALLEKERQIQILNEDKKRTLSYLLTSGLITLGLVSLILLISRNNKAKANRLLKQQSVEIRSKNEEIEMQKVALMENNKHLESLNEDKNELIGMVAHDLRSPLNQIKGLINILKITVKTDISGKEIIEKIDGSTDRLRVLVNRTLDLQAIESKKINLNKEIVDLAALAQCVVDNQQQAAEEKQITIFDKLAKNSCFVNVDRNYTIQIIENLLCNALKFSNKQSKVEVLVYQEDNRAKLEIIDEGPGLSETDKKKLFIPYQQLSAKPTNKEKSTGLGLAIVKKYANAMGGEVLCKSQFGHGAKFIVLFELVEEPMPTLPV
ncbi:MAG: tetratricopeptide repeat-containing sensor histidine kinase [Cytophagales bacterium]|nr:tetratricopeptide repeat-containing sensor histidine kinase [Cytophagales bacterium]